MDLNQSRSWVSYSSYEIIDKFNLGNLVLAATHNRFKSNKYDSILIIAVDNKRAPYAFINCNSLVDFENQKKAQDRYEWIEDACEITGCTIDSETGLVVTSNVAQMIEIYEISNLL